MNKGSQNVIHILISCGELSVEKYATKLLPQLRAVFPNAKISAMCSDLLSDCGVDCIQNYEKISVMGFSSVVSALPEIIKARRNVIDFIKNENVDLFIPIDFPGFNSIISKAAKKNGVLVYNIVAPQFWAWGSWRAKGLKKSVDKLVPILPFEEKYFADLGVSTKYLGHPLMEVYNRENLPGIRKQREATISEAKSLTIGFLPGSRTQEIQELLPVYKEIIKALKAENRGTEINCKISCAKRELLNLFDSLPSCFQIETTEISDFVKEIDLAVVCSGTASLEVALSGIPHSLVYKTSKFNYEVGKKLVNVDYVGLTNIIMGELVVEEFVQQNATCSNIVDDLTNWIRNQNRRAKFDSDIDSLHIRLGGTGFWERVAQDIKSFIIEDGSDVC